MIKCPHCSRSNDLREYVIANTPCPKRLPKEWVGHESRLPACRLTESHQHYVCMRCWKDFVNVKVQRNPMYKETEL